MNIYLRIFQNRRNGLIATATTMEAWQHQNNLRGVTSMDVDILHVGTKAAQITLKVTYHNTHSERAVLNALRAWWVGEWSKIDVGGSEETERAATRP